MPGRGRKSNFEDTSGLLGVILIMLAIAVYMIVGGILGLGQGG